MSSHVEALFWGTTQRLLGGEGSGSVHIAYEDLYASIIFLACIYVGGQIAARLLKMPRLVCCDLAVKPANVCLPLCEI